MSVILGDSGFASDQGHENRPGGCPQQWKLDVNDRYQRAVGTITTLSTAAIVLPVVFLKDVSGTAPGRTILAALNGWTYAAWILLAAAVCGAVVYYYSSAKWVKLAWEKPTDMFGVPVQPPFVESVLDVSYFVMMAGFLAGLGCIVTFMATVKV